LPLIWLVRQPLAAPKPAFLGCSWFGSSEPSAQELRVADGLVGRAVELDRLFRPLMAPG
jgi:hypothetical protein